MVAVIVSGPPASGKTVLAGRLSSALHLPVFSRDAIKERLFDSLGAQDRAWSGRLGAASYDILFSVAESLFASRQMCILETNFTDLAGETLQKMALRYDVALVQVFCTAGVEFLRERFETRVKAAERHPGHGDADRLAEEGDSLFEGVSSPLAVAGPVIMVDTADFALIDYGALAREVAAQLRLVTGRRSGSNPGPAEQMMIDG